jgi:hypothetical protein
MWTFMYWDCMLSVVPAAGQMQWAVGSNLCNIATATCIGKVRSMYAFRSVSYNRACSAGCFGVGPRVGGEEAAEIVRQPDAEDEGPALPTALVGLKNLGKEQDH